MEIKHQVNPEFISICRKILDENLDLHNWSLIESDDQFQTENYCGGFDATENEFCFSYYKNNGIEYWFQLSLSDINSIAKEEISEFSIRKAE